MKSTVLFLRVAILSVAIGIILGAFGAHALKEFFSDYETDIWNKGIFYQITNSLGLILIILLIKNNLIKESKLAMLLLCLGIVFFFWITIYNCINKCFLKPKSLDKINYYSSYATRRNIDSSKLDYHLY